AFASFCRTECLLQRTQADGVGSLRRGTGIDSWLVAGVLCTPQKWRFMSSKKEKEMATTKLTGKELRAIGFPEGRVIATAMEVMEKHYKGKSKKQKLELLQRVVLTPAWYVKHDTLGPVATGLIIKTEHNEPIAL